VRYWGNASIGARRIEERLISKFGATFTLL
jgi:hypothetical protein